MAEQNQGITNILKSEFKKRVRINKILEAYEQSEKKDFHICLLNENNPKILFLVKVDQQLFDVISYQQSANENSLVNQITDLVKINSKAVICSHYDGSLIIYKNFQNRELKAQQKYQEIIGKQFDQSAETNDMKKIILYVSVFKQKDHLKVLCEYFDGQMKLIHLNPNTLQQSNLIEINYPAFILRKYLNKEQILCGFIDNSTFMIIKSSPCNQSLQNTIISLGQQTQEFLSLNEFELSAFDTHMEGNKFKILCIYTKNQKDQILCSFIHDGQNALSLQTSLNIKSEYGEIVQVVSTENKYDAILLFKHKLIAYKLYDQNEEYLIYENYQEEFILYHFQNLNDFPTHLLISQARVQDKFKQEVRYFFKL